MFDGFAADCAQHFRHLGKAVSSTARRVCALLACGADPVKTAAVSSARSDTATQTILPLLVAAIGLPPLIESAKNSKVRMKKTGRKNVPPMPESGSAFSALACKRPKLPVVAGLRLKLAV